ncbi:MAG TPA: M23 family peptidase [Xanthomonadales bacterium]|nr:M23 family peptidase [Xanthomonadales bacterium]
MTATLRLLLILPTAVISAISLTALAPACAGTVYKWTDSNGVVHYTDRAPPQAGQEAAAVERIRYAAEPKPLARMALDTGDGQYRAIARNLIHGHIEVELRYRENRNIDSRPPLPTRHVLPGLAQATVAELFPADRSQAGRFTLDLNAVPGRPDAQPEDYQYDLPVRGPFQLGQGFGGAFSHTDDQSRYAIDIGVAEGTPILAARAGRVMQVESDFDRSGLDREKFADRANHIRIEHADGTMAVYAHLQPDGTLVRPGQTVRAGQHIGYSGNTGFSTGPHLHFAVQVNRGMRLESIPFRMRSDAGPLPLTD